MNSLNPQTSRSTEDLDAVIGRFQAWTMTQTQTKPAVKNNVVSEISYEQALRATARYHRAETPADPLPQTSAWTAKPASEPAEKIEQPKVQAASPVRNQQHGKNARRAATARKTSAAAITPVVADQPAKKAKPQRESFAQVLRQETGLARVDTSALRSSALTVRLAPDESALIKARADEAQMSTSAYLRQCALEVEALREQVRETLAKMHTSSPVPAAPVSTPALPAVAGPSRPGLFGGLRNWLIRRLGGQQIDAVC